MARLRVVAADGAKAGTRCATGHPVEGLGCGDCLGAAEAEGLGGTALADGSGEMLGDAADGLNTAAAEG